MCQHAGYPPTVTYWCSLRYTERKRSESLQSVLYAISEAVHITEDLLKLFQRIHEIVGTLLPWKIFP